MKTTAAPPSHFPGRQRWFRLRKFVIHTFWVAVCLVVIGVFWSLWYVNTRGFSKKWRRTLTMELEKRGIYVSVTKLTLNPLRGLVAKEVYVVQAGERGRALAAIDEVVLDINYSNLVHHEPFINSIDLRDATLTLPLESNIRGGERLEINILNARIEFPPHRLDLIQAEADVHGLHISATGKLLNPDKLRSDTAKTPPGSKSTPRQVMDCLQAWDRLKITGGHPRLEIQFSGDLENPAQTFGQAVLRAGELSIDGSYRVRSIDVTATYKEGFARLEQCAVVDSRGRLDGSGIFRPLTGEAEFQLHSTLDLQGIAHSTHVDPLADEFVFYAPPTLELSGRANFNAKEPGFGGKLLGRLTLERFSTKSILFEGASADFSWDEGRWFLHDARVLQRNGSLVLNAMRVPGSFQFSLNSSNINPKVLHPLLSPSARAALADLDFQAAPTFHLQGAGPSPSLDQLTASGQIGLGFTRYRGIGLSSAALNLQFKDNILTIPDFKIERPEGQGTGTVVYDFNSDVLQLLHVKTTLIPTDITATFDKDLTQTLAAYRFRTRPALLVDGSVDCRKGRFQHNNLRIDVDGSGGMDYTFIRRNLFTPKIKATVLVERDRVKISGLEGSLFGGTIRGAADVSIVKEKGDYTAEIQTDEIDFPSLTKLYFDYDTSTGKLNGSFNFSGRHDFAREIKGTGQLTVTEGNVFAIPLLGPFSGIINELFPGTGYHVAHKGTCTFDMQDGVVHTGDLVVKGKGFSMLGEGKLFVLDDKIDFNIRIAGQGAAGMILSPVSHLLEYTADTTLSKPNWHLKRLPKALFTPHAEGSATPGSSPAPASAPARLK